ncbi:C2 calcium-dependent membrane targeting [Cinnamomum micranthum f. kanehirae]|uniref:C2 calcium-dependent membrane targeting n=1 Tax=Cinnamomum micranthum f. kanehirae TaxID=337451 RepID=A0A443PM19_9MAGN|nr:C2 calcium-dependent membrane targeting [Cinnamomum micranthum f. kanehirae]
MKGELKLAIWMGTAADEAFPDARHSDAASTHVDVSMASYIRSKVYFSPRLWYMHVEIIEAEDLVLNPGSLCEGTDRPPDVEKKVEDQGEPNRVKVIRRVIIPLSSIEKRADDRMIKTWCFQLEKPIAAVHVKKIKEDELSGLLLLRLCLEGGYHVMDESSHYSSDLRPTAEELWNPPIGV